MKGGNFGTNGSDLDKNNIIKPTIDTLIELTMPISKNSSSRVVK
jgi:hypothetical protein